MASKAKGKAAATIVIRREEAGGGGHHGGAWKVAYADFVTAMMAFFLVMWLINATTEKQRRGLADYFSPMTEHTKSTSGSGKPFGGLTPYETGSLVSNRGAVNLKDTSGANSLSGPGTAARGGPATNVGDKAASKTDPDDAPVMGNGDKAGTSSSDGDDNGGGASDGGDDAGAEAAGRATGTPKDQAVKEGHVAADQTSAQASGQTAAQLAAQAAKARAEAVAAVVEQKQLASAAASLQRNLASDPDLADVASQIKVDLEPDGLHIQITDSDHQPMFAPGADEPNPRARLLFSRVAPVLAKLDEPVSIAGHTDGAACVGACRSNWDLSAARADATRVVLEHEGLGDARIANVAGYADRDLLLPGDPLNAANRRIVLVVHRTHAPPAPVAASAAATQVAAQAATTH